MSKLVRDDGEIRKCPNNMAKMGYVKSYIEFFGYKESLNAICWDELIESIIESIKAIANAILFAVLFPILPFVRCYFSVKKAKKEVEQERRMKRVK